MNAARIVMTVGAALLLPWLLAAQDEFDDFGPKPTGAVQARTQYAANLAAHKGNADMLVLPGLVADRTARQVEVLAECTGLGDGETIEFLLIDQGSSHGYEGLLWSFAKPSDVHRALEFIGLKPGTPYNPAALRFWADGDRVLVSVKGDADELVPIERLVLDTEADETLPEEGFVFAGSIMVPPRDGKGAAQYAADIYDPRSVASIYNEPAAVLDVPRRASKGDVYGSQVVNPEYALEGGKLLTIVLAPGDPDGEQRARELALAVDFAPASTGEVCRLTEAGGTVLEEAVSLAAVLERLVQIGKGGTAPYMELSFSGALPIAQVTRTCALMAVLEMMESVRIKPPSEGQLYYRAFVPDKAWLTPQGRPTQPWELHLSCQAGAVAARMVFHDPTWPEGSIAPVFERIEHRVADPAAVRARLDVDAQERLASGRSPLPPVLLVFVAPDLTYGQVMRFVKPVMGTHGTVYVFREDK